MDESLRFVFLVFILWFVLVPKHCGAQEPKEIENRKGKFFSWLGVGVGVVRFENAVCNAANGLRGICYTRRQCTTVGGYTSGRCARNIGFCCVVQNTCGATSANNNTYFSNLNFPNTFTGSTTCSLTIQRCNSNICQVRIDFLSLILSQPNGDGICSNDRLTVTGGASPFGPICGENTGQHIYLDFNNASDIQINIYTSVGVSLGRQWNIRVAQIGCDSPSRAPSGCLMYYTEVTGTVTSFNYGTTASSMMSSLGATGTRQIANQNYGVCVRMEPGFCSITWSQTSTISFTVSNDTEGSSEILGTSDASVTGTMCPFDFVVIPNPQVNNVAVPYDRFCGNAIPAVTTSSKPFVLTVVTNGNEVDGIANRGFALNYAQQPCAPVIAGT